MNYGVVADGQYSDYTDNSEALAAAIADAKESGSYVYLPIGTYGFTDVRASNVEIRGEDSDETRLQRALLYLYNGATLMNCNVYNNGVVHVYAGATIEDCIVDEGFIYVYAGGTLKGCTVREDSSVHVYEGGTVSGCTFFQETNLHNEGGTVEDCVDGSGNPI